MSRVMPGAKLPGGLQALPFQLLRFPLTSLPGYLSASGSRTEREIFRNRPFASESALGVEGRPFEAVTGRVRLSSFGVRQSPAAIVLGPQN